MKSKLLITFLSIALIVAVAWVVVMEQKNSDIKNTPVESETVESVEDIEVNTDEPEAVTEMGSVKVESKTKSKSKSESVVESEEAVEVDIETPAF